MQTFLPIPKYIIVFLFFVVAVTCNSALAAIRYVKMGVAGTAPYTSWATASNDLQAVINQCVAGDEIWIAAGTYNPLRRADATGTVTTGNRNNAFVLKSNVRIYGGFIVGEATFGNRNPATNTVILSGDIGTASVTTDNCYHVVIAAGIAGTTTRLEGVSINFGSADAGVLVPKIVVNGININPRLGGGLYKANATLKTDNCNIRRNGAIESGAGLYEYSSSVSSVYSNCSFAQNTCSGDGGGTYLSLSSAAFETCTFLNNNATGEGAGIYLTGNVSPALEDCTVTGNDAGSNGGGICNYATGTPEITSTIISGNSSGSTGGGIFNNNSPVGITNCLVSGNLAAAGGGIWNSFSDAVIINCTIAGNRATAQGGGIANGSSNPTIQNCIVYGNTGVPTTTNTIYNSGSIPVIDYSLIQGGYIGTANVNANPLFINQVAASAAPTTTGDYKVQKCSPVLNAGNNSGIPSGITSDLDAANRIFYGKVDMGAYELQLSLAVSDANGIVYVDLTKTGNGSSWANAVADLSDALVAAKYDAAIQQIWVAKGTYKPKYNAADNNSLVCNTTNRDNAFVLVKDVKLYGGFAGGEADTSGRNFTVNETILSGDLGSAANTDNCYHIVISPGNIGTAELNGFAIMAGNANGSGTITVNGISIERQNGAAVFNASSASSLTVENCIIKNNVAAVEAGGFFSRANSAAIINACSFSANTVSAAGGNGGAAIYNETNATVIISNSTFTSNISVTSTPGYGGAILNSVSSIVNITNSSFTSNQSNNGGAIHNNNCNLIISGCTFNSNTALSTGGAISYNNATAKSEIIDCNFSGNNSKLGGALYGINSSFPVEISNCSFSSNSANGVQSLQPRGGAIALFNRSLTVSKCVFNNNASNIIDDGNPTLEAGGGAIFLTSSILNISQCDFLQNTSSGRGSGGAIYGIGEGSISLCNFKGNSAGVLGGGMFLLGQDTISLMNCIISGNTSHQGGGIYAVQKIKCINCTIASNWANNSGSAIETQSGSILYNCVVWNNKIAGGALTGTYLIRYSNLQGSFTGAGNINTDPLFINPEPASATATILGDYRLQRCSPSINVGSNTLIPPEITKDLDSNNRIVFNTVDMGTYEYRTSFATPDASGIIYVNALKTGDGSSWNNALPDLSDALYEAKSNSAITQIWVAKGTYKPKYSASDNANPFCNSSNRDNAFVLVKDVSVYGGFEGTEADTTGRDLITNETILSGDIGTLNVNTDNCNHVVISAGDVGTTALDGFTVTKGSATSAFAAISVNSISVYRTAGAGMNFKNSSPLVRNCSIVENTSVNEGGGIFMEASSPVITKCNFKNNIAYSGGGLAIYFQSAATINQCSFTENMVSGSGAAIGSSNNTVGGVINNCVLKGNVSTLYGGGIDNFASPIIINNSVITGNKAVYGGAIMTSLGTASFNNCTIAGNYASTNYGGVRCANGDIFTNCILWGNKAGATVQNIVPDGTATVSYSLIEEGYAGTANIIASPLFESPLPASAAPTVNGDYRLQRCSPSLDAGNNTAVVGYTTDIAGNVRIFNTTVDMGAYEKQYALPNTNGIVYVDKTKNGDGKTWATAVPELADALKAAKLNSSITEIWVAKGTYNPLYNAAGNLNCSPLDNRDKAFVMVNNVKVYGSFAGGETDTLNRNFITNETVLDGDIGTAGVTTDNVYHAVISAGLVGTAMINGFSIKNGNANAASGNITVNGQTVSKRFGGGIFNIASSPAIENCIISQNYSSDDGGAMHNSTSSPKINKCIFMVNTTNGDGSAVYNKTSSPVITNSSFIGNSARIGAALYNDFSSAPYLANCIFSGNHATVTAGVIMNASSFLTLINCTLAGNKSNFAGAVLNTDATASIINCIIYGNQAVSGTPISGTGSTVTHSIIEGGFAGTGNYDHDPLFVNPQPASAAPITAGDYHLQACSPAINVGYNTAVSTTSDVDNNPRIMFSDVDLGAYEVQETDYTTTIWRGYNTNWNDKVNWCGGYIPTSATNVTVPATTNNPLIYAGYNNQVKNISLTNTTSLGIANTSSFTINGTYTNNGSTITNNGSWVMAGSATGQTLPGTNGTIAAMNNIEINNPNGVTLDKSFEITGTLIPTNGNIHVNDNVLITLNSDATSTARVAAVQPDASFSYTGTGKFAVERYFPAQRSWRLLTSPLTATTSIYESWQNNGLLETGKGMLITNPAPTILNGLDNSEQKNYSLYTWGDNIQNFVGVNDTKNTMLSNNAATSADNKGYFAFVRGDRTPANTIIPNTNITTLTSTGKLQIGEQVFNANNTINDFTLIGNPYASPVDFNLVTRTNLVKRFYAMDPSLNDVGGWVMLDDIRPDLGTINDGIYTKDISSSAQDQHIQSSQAIIVQTLATTSPTSLTFNESSKSSTNNLNVFRPSNKNKKKEIRTSLYIVNADGSTKLADETFTEFDNAFSGGFNYEDAVKFGNINETFSMLRANLPLCAERRPELTENDTLFYKLIKTTNKNYQLKINSSNIDNTQLEGFLEDSYTNTSTPVDLTGITNYNFAVNSNAASRNSLRFKIVFKQADAGPLPVSFINMNAVEQTNTVKINWVVANEFNVKNYEVERSVDGITFIKIGAVIATGNSNYILTDTMPYTGFNYYRIRSIDVNGSMQYSKITMLNIVRGESITIYPNPVTGKIISFEIMNMPQGSYKISLMTALGQIILQTTIEHTTMAPAIKTIIPKRKLPAGIYTLQVVTPKGDTVTKRVDVL